MAVQEIKCPFCAEKVSVQTQWLGMTLKCPFCSEQFVFSADMQSSSSSPNAILQQTPPPFYNNVNSGTYTNATTPKPTMLTALTKFADFSTRASRREYWLFVILNFIIQFPISIASGIASIAMADNPAVAVALNGLATLISLIFFIPGLAVAVRRCHDTGHSGWWVLMILIPCVGPIIFLVTMCQRSLPFANQWGSNPITDGNDEMWPCALGLVITIVPYVIVMLMIPAAMLIPAIGAARDKAREASCVNNLKQIGNALMVYQQDDQLGRYPVWQGRDGMELLRTQDYLNEEDCYICPSVRNDENSDSVYYYLGDGLDEKSTDPDIPVVICNTHNDKKLLVLYADGVVNFYDLTEPIYSVTDMVKFILKKNTKRDLSGAETVLKNAQKIDDCRTDLIYEKQR